MAREDIEMSRERRADQQMHAECFTGDYEHDHSRADAILVEFLRSLGFDVLADTYERVGKWYA
jgi:hypothetical protein